MNLIDRIENDLRNARDILNGRSDAFVSDERLCWKMRVCQARVWVDGALDDIDKWRRENMKPEAVAAELDLHAIDGETA